MGVLELSARCLEDICLMSGGQGAGVGHGTSIREVYFFGPKSILFLLKYAQIYFFVAIEDISTEFWAKFGISRKIIA